MRQRPHTHERWRSTRGTFSSHASLSLTGGIVSAVLTLVTVPYSVSRLGVGAYGLFTLLGVTTAYVGVLDLGFSWTSTRYLAEAIARDDAPRVRALLRATIVFYLTIGLIGALVLAGLAHVLVHHVFRAPRGLQWAGEASAYTFAAAFPFAMLQVYASALLRGASRFGLNSALQVAASLASNVGLVTALALGGHLLAASMAVAAGQTVVAVGALAASRWIFPSALSVGRVDRGLLRTLARFSGSVTIANLGAQLLYLPNRFAVGALMPVASAGIFNVPLALAQRLLLFPSALASASLPRLTAAATRDDDAEFRRGFWQFNAWTAALLLPPAILAALWAPAVLGVWVSPTFRAAAWVLRLALLAVVANAATSSLGVAASAAGKPGIDAIATVAAGAVNCGLAFALTNAFGMNGSAAALLTAFVFLVITMLALWRRWRLPRLSPLEVRGPTSRGAVTAVAAAAWIAAAWTARNLPTTRVELVVSFSGFLLVAYLGLGVATRTLRLARPSG